MTYGVCGPKEPKEPKGEKKSAKESKQEKKSAKEEVVEEQPIILQEELTSDQLLPDDDDSPEIEARIISYNGVNYLIDQDSNVYHETTFEEIGTFQNDIITFF